VDCHWPNHNPEANHNPKAHHNPPNPRHEVLALNLRVRYIYEIYIIDLTPLYRGIWGRYRPATECSAFPATGPTTPESSTENFTASTPQVSPTSSRPIAHKSSIPSVVDDCCCCNHYNHNFHSREVYHSSRSSTRTTNRPGNALEDFGPTVRFQRWFVVNYDDTSQHSPFRYLSTPTFCFCFVLNHPNLSICRQQEIEIQRQMGSSCSTPSVPWTLPSSSSVL